MQKNKLLLLFAALTKVEARHFGKYVGLSYFNSNKKIIDLVYFMSKQLQKYTVDDYDKFKEKAFEKIYPNESFNSQKLRNLMSGTFELLIGFLALEELKLSKKKEGELLRSFFLRRQLNDFYAGSLALQEKKLLKDEVRDMSYYLSLAQLYQGQYYNVYSNKYKTTEPMSNLEKIHQVLDLGYLLPKLHFSLELLIVQRQTGQAKAISSFKEILQTAKENEGNDLVEFYLNAIALLETPTEKAYFQLEEALFKIFPLAEPNLQGYLFGMLINLAYLSVQVNSSQVFFKLYQKGFAEKILFDNESIIKEHFCNYIDIGTNLGKFYEVRQFITENLVLLELGKDSLANIQTLFGAIVYFGERKYDKALQHLAYLEFEDYSYGFRAYTLKIQCLYEIEKEHSFQVIHGVCKTFGQYIRRKLKDGFISKQMQEERLNFMRIARKLPISSKSRYVKVPVHDLKEELLKMKRVICRKWLLEKIDDIEK